MYLFIFLLNVFAISVDGVNLDDQRRYQSFSDEKTDMPKPLDKELIILDNSTFYYFAYGTNLLESKLRIHCPSANFISVASLQGWRLDFNSNNDMWNGAEATIVEDPKSCVWGALYTIYRSEIWNLDNEAGVAINAYYEKSVKVKPRSGKKLDYEVTARTHVQYNPPEYVAPENLPIERRPSRTYSEVMYFGALRAGLPAKYLRFLKKFPDNDEKLKEIVLEEMVGYPFYDDIEICEQSHE